MDIDLSIARNLSNNEVFLRFYKWKPYCISLGANQNEIEIDITKTSKDNIDVVKRPTGGRAILHAEELTYSAAIPLSINLTPQEIYAKISLSLIKGLIKYAPSLKQKLELENQQPNFPALLKKPSGTLCFASTAKSEVKFDGKKLIGSAQRKLENSVLQHGSILIGKYHGNLPDYLKTSERKRKFLKAELLKKTTELETILNLDINYGDLEKCMVIGFEEEWNIHFQKSPNTALNFCR